MDINLPEEAVLNGDRGYNDYFAEDMLKEAEEIEFRPHSPLYFQSISMQLIFKDLS
jgi:hypothetical protein